MLKTNTSKKRTLSLFIQRLYWFQALPNMRAEWRRPLMKAFAQVLQENAMIRAAFAETYEK